MRSNDISTTRYDEPLNLDNTLKKIKELKALCNESLSNLEEAGKKELKKNAGLYTTYCESNNDNSQPLIERVMADLKTERALCKKLGIDLPSGEDFKSYQPLKLFVETQNEFSQLLTKYTAITSLNRKLDKKNSVTLLDDFSKALAKMKTLDHGSDSFYRSAKHILNFEKKDPLNRVLTKILSLPDFKLENLSINDFDQINLNIMQRESYNKSHEEFLKDLNEILFELNLNISNNEFNSLKTYYSLLRNEKFFGFFQAINAALTHIWNQLYIHNKAPEKENLLGGDDMPILLKPLLPNDLAQLQKLLDRLNILQKLSNLVNEDGYAIIMLTTAVKDKIASFSSLTINPDEKKKEPLILPVVNMVQKPAFVDLVNAFTVLRPIKNSCKEYHDSLLRALDAEMAANKSLYQRFKHDEGVIGLPCLLNIGSVIMALDNNDPQLKGFVDGNTKFRVTLKKYRGLNHINDHFKENNSDPFKTLDSFKDDFKENLGLFNECEDGPGKRFVKRVISILSGLFAPCFHRKSQKTSSEIFVSNVSSFFQPKPEMNMKTDSPDIELTYIKQRKASLI